MKKESFLNYLHFKTLRYLRLNFFNGRDRHQVADSPVAFDSEIMVRFLALHSTLVSHSFSKKYSFEACKLVFTWII